jgi:hypothetical protein
VNGSYDAFTGTPMNPGVDVFQGLNGLKATAQEVAGNTMPLFGILKLDNGANAINITNAGGLAVGNSLYFSNGITNTTRAAMDAGSVKFLAGSTYTSTNAGDAQYVNGYVTKIGNTGFTFPVGSQSGTEYRPMTIGAPSAITDTLSIAYYSGSAVSDPSNPAADLTSLSTAVVNGYKLSSVSALGFWDWIPVHGTSGVTIAVSIPDMSGAGGYATGAEMRLVGYNTVTSKWEILDSTGGTANTAGTVLNGYAADMSNYSALGIGGVVAACTAPSPAFTLAGLDPQELVGNSFVFNVTNVGIGANYAWSYGDSTGGTGASVTKSYGAAGLFTVKLVATDNGCSDSSTLDVHVMSGSVGGGGGGGLESESMGGLITRRDYLRQKAGRDNRTIYSKMPLFVSAYPVAAVSRTTGVQTLSDILPRSLGIGDEPRVTSPSDLIGLTIAKEVLAVDYVKNNQAKAVSLGITTLDRAYNHTKSICDRFRGAEILSIEKILVDGKAMNMFSLRQKNGTVEYAVAFVAGMSGKAGYSLQTNWVISQYQREDTSYNFQIWAANPAHTKQLAGEVLGKMGTARGMTLLQGAEVPKAYITKGVRKGANLEVTIRNNSTVKSGTLTLEARSNEQSGVSMIEVPMSLPAGRDTMVVVPIGDGYEYQGSFNLGTELTDEVYLADGNWGLDKDASQTRIQKFEALNNPNRVYSEDEYPLYRDVELKATTTDYVSVYKALSPGTEPTDLREYKSLKFWAKGSGKAEIVLTKDSIAAFKSQYRKIIDLNPEGADYAISLLDFSSSAVEAAIHANDLKTLVITFAPDAGEEKTVAFSLKEAAFSRKEASSIRGLNSTVMSVSPNPITGGHFNLSFSSEAERELTLKVTDLLGRTVYSKVLQAGVGTNNVSVDMPADLPTATTLLISLNGENKKYEVVKVQSK